MEKKKTILLVLFRYTRGITSQILTALYNDSFYINMVDIYLKNAFPHSKVNN